MASAPPPIKLKLGGTSKPVPLPDPVDEPSLSANAPATVGVTVDQAALQRQRELVAAGINGHASVPSKSIQADERGTVLASTPPKRAKSEDERAPTPLQIAPSAIKHDPKPVLQSKQSSGIDTRLPEITVESAATAPTGCPSDPAVRNQGVSSLSEHTAQPSTQTVSQPYFPHVVQISGIETKWRQDGKGPCPVYLLRYLIANTYVCV